jgi:hypothetical protein
MRKIYLLLLGVLLCFFSFDNGVMAENTNCNICDDAIILYETPAPDPFTLEPPAGWIRDIRAGSSQGVYQVFYPEGKTWEESPVVAYGRFRIKDNHTKTIKDQVADTIKDFQNNSSLNIKAEFKESIKLPSGKQAEVYYYTGDKYGNFEVASYIEETKTINFIVMSAKNKNEFDSVIDKYYELVKSYKVSELNISK